MQFPDKIDYTFHPGDLVLPKVFRARQKFPRPRLDDVPAAVRKEMEAKLPLDKVAGKRVALTGGSRGVADQALVLKTVATVLKDHGAKPFIVPAMGSHGGATAEGQRDFLAGYGITEDKMGVPILSSMDVARLGTTKSGFPVFCDRNAAEADYILPVHRVKPHTDFKADIESGLCKIMAIGLGKHEGATHIHAQRLIKFGEHIPETAEVYLSTGKILGGVAIVENAYDETMLIEAVRTTEWFEKEKALLVKAKEAMARFFLDSIDVLVIEQIGKEVSGHGMDPNVTGRSFSRLPGFDYSLVQRIVVLGLSEATHGNATGIGVADIVTIPFMKQIDLGPTYINALTSRGVTAAAIPLIANHDRDAVTIGVHCSYDVPNGKAKIVQIRDTLHMGDLVLSEPYLEQVKKDSRFEIVSDLYDLKFDANGKLERIGKH